VGVLVVYQNRIRQFVMSCRVVGMDVELAVLALIHNLFLQKGCPVLLADFAETSVNLLCRDLYKKAGFVCQNGVWTQKICRMQSPPKHVAACFKDQETVPSEA
jgi:predicted enzyme involved in methoxymalonyl-ACP biosynthesis